VFLYTLLRCTAASKKLPRARRGGLAFGHGGSSRAKAQAKSCCVVVSCRWCSLLRSAPAFSSSVPFTHAMVNGVAVTRRPATDATKHARKAQFLLSLMLNIEVIHEDLNHDEALLATLCCAWTRNHYTCCSSPQIPRMRNMYTKTKYSPRTKWLLFTMLQVIATHEDLPHAVAMPKLSFCAWLHTPMPYILLQPQPEYHAGELHAQTRQLCKQAHTTTKELSSPMPSQAKTIDENR
jgi:hypothetical protein